MKRTTILVACLLAGWLMCPPSRANEVGRNTTAQILAGLTAVASYEQQPIAVAALGIGTIYAEKRLNDDIRNNRIAAAQAGGYSYYGAPQYGGVVPASYSNSYSQGFSYKGYSYHKSEANSASFRTVPPPRYSAPQVVYIIVQSAPKAASSAQPISGGGYVSDSAYNPNSHQYQYPRTAQTVPANYNYPQTRVTLSSYSSSSSEHVSGVCGSYSYSQHNSATYQPVPAAQSAAQPHSTVIYYP